MAKHISVCLVGKIILFNSAKSTDKLANMNVNNVDLDSIFLFCCTPHASSSFSTIHVYKNIHYSFIYQTIYPVADYAWTAHAFVKSPTKLP